MTIALSLLLAALVGFAIHRASLCTVRAVAEVLTTRRAYMLSAFGKTTLWVAATTVGMILLLGNASAPGAGWPVSLRAAAGGFAFGAMLLGIATVLAIGRMVTDGTAQVDCHGDLCREPSSPDDGAGTVAGDRA